MGVEALLAMLASRGGAVARIEADLEADFLAAIRAALGGGADLARGIAAGRCRRARLRIAALFEPVQQIMDIGAHGRQQRLDLAVVGHRLRVEQVIELFQQRAHLHRFAALQHGLAGELGQLADHAADIGDAVFDLAEIDRRMLLVFQALPHRFADLAGGQFELPRQHRDVAGDARFRRGMAEGPGNSDRGEARPGDSQQLSRKPDPPGL